MKTKMKKIALFLIAYLVITKINSLEVCEKHKNIDGTKYEAQNCTLHCCGSCNRRYCCYNLTNRLDQKSCAPENCLAYFSFFQDYYQPSYCYRYGQFCCGSCLFRYCCSNPTWRLNQSSCAITEQIITTKTSTRMIDFTFTRKSDLPSKTDLPTVFGSLGSIVLFLLFYYLWNWYAHRLRQRQLQRQQIESNAISYFLFLRSVTQTLNNEQSNRNISTSADHPNNNVQPSSTNNETNNIYNTNVYDDLPPTYAALNFKDQKTEKTEEETVEANNNPSL